MLAFDRTASGLAIVLRRSLSHLIHCCAADNPIIQAKAWERRRPFHSHAYKKHVVCRCRRSARRAALSRISCRGGSRIVVPLHDTAASSASIAPPRSQPTSASADAYTGSFYSLMALEDGGAAQSLAGLFPANLPIATTGRRCWKPIAQAWPHLHPLTGRSARSPASRLSGRRPSIRQSRRTVRGNRPLHNGRDTAAGASFTMPSTSPRGTR